jgi:putative DNA primase/helicase
VELSPDTVRKAAEAAQLLGIHGAGPRQPDVAYTDHRAAVHFTEFSAGRVLWCEPWRTWLVWDGKRFMVDGARQFEVIARQSTKALYGAAYQLEDLRARQEQASWALRLEERRRFSAMLEEAKALVAVKPEDLDSHPHVLNLQNGTLDPRGPTLSPHSMQDRLTKLAGASYDPSATCPRFERFLDQVCDHDGQLVRYWQRVFGYALTAEVSVHALFVLWGTGRNGKSTLLFVLRALAGDYAHHARADVFTDRSEDPQGFALVNLRGARVLTAVETGSGARLNETLVKELTGGDPITCAPKWGAEFTFVPVFKAFLATNVRPEIRGTDNGIWSRPRLIPFRVTFAEGGQRKDNELKTELLAELPGILNFALAGLAEFRQTGLADPPAVRNATQSYRDEMDPLADWLEGRCAVDAGLEDGFGDLYADYKQFAGDSAVSDKRFALALDGHGFQVRKGSKGRRLRVGLARLAEAQRLGRVAVSGPAPNSRVAVNQEFPLVLTRPREGNFRENTATHRHPPPAESVQLPARMSQPEAPAACAAHPRADVVLDDGWRCAECRDLAALKQAVRP